MNKAFGIKACRFQINDFDKFPGVLRFIYVIYLKTSFMYNSTIKFFSLFLFHLTISITGFSQQNKLFIASGGAFSNPNDHVNITVLDRNSHALSGVGEVFTQAVQSVAVNQTHLYVAATDSLSVFSTVDYSKLTTIAISGPREMLLCDDKLFVSVQYPETSGFLKIYNASNLALISVVDEISDEAAAMLHFGNKIYVAVPGSWMSTVGKLAILNTDGTFIEEIELGEAGVGIFDLYAYQDKVVSINRSPWGSNAGYLSVFDTISKSVQHFDFPYVIGKGIGVFDGLLYLLLDHGIGAIDMETMQVVQTQIVPDPGSASYISFGTVKLDPVLSRFYATTTDYFSFGQGYVYSIDGTLIDTFDAGISPEALALWDDGITANETYSLNTNLLIYPNPAKDMVFIQSELNYNQIKVFSAQGNIVESKLSDSFTNIYVGNWLPGIYIIQLHLSDGNVVHGKFMKL